MAVEPRVLVQQHGALQRLRDLVQWQPQAIALVVG
jgi:hypothetical protein